jgi:signal transduction histidine kinase
MAEDEKNFHDDALSQLVELLAEEHRTHAVAAMNIATRAEINANDFLAIASHDLLTPLMAITGVAVLIRDNAFVRPPDQQLQDWADDLFKSANNMERLIRDLEFGAFDSGQLRLSTARQDLAAIVHQATDTFLPLASARSIVLSRDVTGSVWVNGDRSRIFHVLLNVIDNAIKFTPAGGVIRVRLSPRDADCVVAVVDTGIGIPKANLASIFTPAAQRDLGDPIGRGLGLYISRLIVEAHGGRMWAESESGAGSTLYFTLPVV